MSAILSDRFEHIHGDEDFHELTQGDLERIEREAQRLAIVKLCDPAWWNQCLEGHNTITAELPSLMATNAGAALAHPQAQGAGQQLLMEAVGMRVIRFCNRIAREAALAEGREEALAMLEDGELPASDDRARAAEIRRG